MSARFLLLRPKCTYSVISLRTLQLSCRHMVAPHLRNANLLVNHYRCDLQSQLYCLSVCEIVYLGQRFLRTKRTEDTQHEKTESGESSADQNANSNGAKDDGPKKPQLDPQTSKRIKSTIFFCKKR